MKVIASKTGAFTASLFKALSDIDRNWPKYQGLLLTGSHEPNEVQIDKVVELIRQARTENVPTLGLCFGLEMAVVEYARNILNWPKANSEEIDPKAEILVIDKLPGMRAGVRPVLDRMENHWHQYKVAEKMVPLLAKDFSIIATGDIVEQMKLNGHPFFVLTQYHPEYSSFPWDPHPVLAAFIEACKKQK